MIGMKFKGMTYTKQMVDDRKKYVFITLKTWIYSWMAIEKEMSKFKL